MPPGDSRVSDMSRNHPTDRNGAMRSGPEDPHDKIHPPGAGGDATKKGIG